MIRRTMELEDEGELIAAEQAVAMARELKELADAAPDGRILAVVEAAALERGRLLVDRPIPHSSSRDLPETGAWPIPGVTGCSTRLTIARP